MDGIEFYKIKKDAFDTANEWDSAKDKRGYCEREFCKPYNEHLAKYLINKGAFTIKLNDDIEDANTFDLVKFLLANSKKFGFKKWFVNFLSNIKADNLYYARAVEMQNNLDKIIDNLVKNIGHEYFTKKILVFLNNVDWGGSEFDKGDCRTIENSKGLYTVEAATYLIKRSLLFEKNNNRLINFQEDNADYNKLFNETLRFMYAKQKTYEMCLFGSSNSSFLFRKRFGVDRKLKCLYSGVIFQNIYNIQLPKLNSENNDYEKLMSFCFSFNSKMLGLQSNNNYKHFLSLKIVEGLSFMDAWESALRMIEYSEITNSEETIVSEQKLDSLLRNVVLKRALVARPCELIDLYQTPFLKINGKYYYSKKIILHGNILTNSVTSLMKKRENNLLEQKGVNFEDQVFNLLNGQVAELKHSIKFVSKSSIGVLEGDIDIIALENGTLYIMECKSEFTSLDYYDYRRELDIIDRATLQLDKIMAFLNTEAGKNLLKRKFAYDVSSCKLFPCIIVSNCRTSCIEDSRYPIYSFFELELAKGNGNFEFDGTIIQFNDRFNRGVFDSLKERNLVKELEDSVVTVNIALKTKKRRYKLSMEEFEFDTDFFVYRLTKNYSVPKKIKRKCNGVFSFKAKVLAIIIILIFGSPLLIAVLKYILSLLIN